MIKGRGVNPADAFRKQEKKKDAKKAKQQRDELRDVRGMLNDPTKIDAEIEKVQKLSDENRLDKGLKDKIAELKRMREVAVGKQKVDAAMGRKPQPVTSSSSSTTLNHTAGNNRIFQPQDSVYFHPVHNPFAIPPPGQLQMWKKDAPPPPPPSAARMQPMAMGGMHGIPLPPPRGPPPPPQQIEAPSANAASRINKRRIVEVVFDDPLDPAATGYESQFGRKAKRATINDDDRDGHHQEQHIHHQSAISTIHISPAIKDQTYASDEEVGPSLPMSFPPLAGYAPMTEYDNNDHDNNKSSKKKKEKVEEQPRIMLPGLEDYGDDDEEEDDDEEDEQEQEEQDIGPSMPMDYDEYAATFYQSDGAYPPLPEMPDPTQEEIPSEVAASVIKAAKVDQALTVFVPAVLKTKKTPKAPAFIPRPPPSIPPAVSVQPKAAVDDEYDLFMQEISGL